MARKINLNKENNEKLYLKRAGHSFIDRIKWKGYSQDHVYILLAKELKIEERRAHFSQMHTLRELRPAVVALESLYEKLPKTSMASRIRKPKPVLSPLISQMPPLKGVTLAQKPQKLSKRQEKKNAIVLPREKMVEAIEQMKHDRLVRERKPTVQGNKLQLKGGLYVYIKRLFHL